MSASSTAQGFFFELTPERVLAAVESSGLMCTGRCMALNSFENRVYDVELESEVIPEESLSGSMASGSAASYLKLDRRIVKFYRPGRWTESQILEEHQFLFDLSQDEVPAIAPLAFADGRTLHQIPDVGIFYAVFPKVGGRAPDELRDEQLLRVGRLLGRMHGVGASRVAQHRLSLTPETYGFSNLAFLTQGRWIPLEFESRYRAAVTEIAEITTPWFQEVSVQRVHGDCHLGNLLWNPMGPFFVDFDDMLVGPAVQDVWLLVPGRDAESVRQRGVLLEGYQEIRVFDHRSLRLIEPLRALRFIYYSTWIARRWDDPAFPKVFPNFGSHAYWLKEVEDLEEQVRLIKAQVDSGPKFF